MKEKLTITCEVDDFQDNTHILSLQIIVIEKGLLSRVFKNWRKITYKPAVITNMQVTK